MTAPAVAPLGWPQVLGSVVCGEDLEPDAASWAMDQIMAGQASPAQIGGFLLALRAKGETVEEMRGLADQMLRHALRIEVAGPTLDVVGTGGDRAHTVNISTMAAVVCAATGVTVVKHGNRAASSSSGAADVLEALGLNLSLSPDRVADVARQAGITFCFSQTFHPSMRFAGPVRRELGVATTFNFLGPLTNPAQPAFMAVGCSDAAMAPLMAGVFAGRGTTAAVFRGDDGLDEVTLATTSSVWWVRDGQVWRGTLDPARLDLGYQPTDRLRGGDAAYNAEVLRRTMAGAAGPVRDAVLLNAGVALAVTRADTLGADPHPAVRAAMDEAAHAIDSGAATRVLDTWIACARG